MQLRTLLFFTLICTASHLNIARAQSDDREMILAVMEMAFAAVQILINR
jgi:hypothetical protein